MIWSGTGSIFVFNQNILHNVCDIYVHEINDLLSEGGGGGWRLRNVTNTHQYGLYVTCKIVTERICHTHVTYVTYHTFGSCSNSFEFMYFTHVAYPFRDINGPTEFLICIFLSS